MGNEDQVVKEPMDTCIYSVVFSVVFGVSFAQDTRGRENADCEEEASTFSLRILWIDQGHRRR